MSNKKEYESKRTCLVLAGGGINGFYMLGALHHLYETGKLNDIKYYIGTSIGAIISTFLSVGIQPFEIFYEACLFDKKLVPRITEFLFDKDSLYSFSDFENVFTQIILKKCGKIPSLGELAEMDRHLVLLSYNSSINKLEEVSWKTHTHISCIDAMCASAAVPLIFPPRIINNHEYIDGGIVSVFPLNVALNYVDPENIISMTFESQDIKEDSLLSKLFKLFFIPINYQEQLLRQTISPRQMHYVLPSNYRVFNLNLSLEEKWKMFLRGREIVSVKQMKAPI